jgi:hypothetical protein
MTLLCIAGWYNCVSLSREPEIQFKSIKKEVKNVEIPYFGFWSWYDGLQH